MKIHFLIQVALITLLYTILRSVFGFDAMVTVALATIVCLLIKVLNGK